MTRHLRQLEKDKIVQRKVYAEVPPRVEYNLTGNGAGIRVVLDAVEKWGLDYIKVARSVELLPMYQELLRK